MELFPNTYNVSIDKVPRIIEFIKEKCSDVTHTDEKDKLTGLGGPIASEGDWKTEKARIKLSYVKKTNNILIELSLVESAHIVWRKTKKEERFRYKVKHSGLLKLE